MDEAGIRVAPNLSKADEAESSAEVTNAPQTPETSDSASQPKKGSSSGKIESTPKRTKANRPSAAQTSERRRRNPELSRRTSKAKKGSPSEKSLSVSKPLKKAAPSWTFPKSTLEDAIKIARAIEEQNAGNPTKPEMLAKAVGYKSVSDWRFLDLLRSANQYGLVSGTGKISPVSLTEIGQDIVAPSTPSARPKALQRAFRAVDDFKKVEDFYRGKKLPEDEFFENTLYRDFSVPRERIKIFIDIFTSNLNYLHAFRPGTVSTGPIVNSELRPREPDLPGQQEGNAGRQFLDTCFVMMPFGQWMDLYYREIYSPAIREAGLEPVRADELFSTGSVIEQIWEQIVRAKVLLADLTGKNANVFYELGLAHAANKPVVFTTGQLEDVPFDLRHLRVAIYDLRDPAWGEKLKGSLSTYLKAAKADPAKSVPQPFRTQLQRDVEPAGNYRARAADSSVVSA